MRMASQKLLYIENAMFYFQKVPDENGFAKTAVH